MVGEDDLVIGKTERKIKIGDDEKKVVRKVIVLSLKVTKSEYTQGILRISGLVQSEHEDIPKGAHHTINAEVGTDITLEKKEWLTYELDLLKQALAGSKSQTMLVVMDREEAHFALLTPQGISRISDLTGHVEKKGNDEHILTDFYEHIAALLESYATRYTLQTIILASPAFWKDAVYKHASEQIKKKIILTSCNTGNPQAFNEVLTKEEVKKALSDEKTHKEEDVVQHVLAEIAKNGKACYGVIQTKAALEMGAIDTLIISSTLISKRKEEGTFSEVNAMMKVAQQQKAVLVVLQSKGSAQKQVDGLGGIAALLRYKI